MTDIQRIIARRKRQDVIFRFIGLACTCIGIVTLGTLLFNLALDGLGRIDMQFLTSFPSRYAARAGILSAREGRRVEVAEILKND